MSSEGLVKFHGEKATLEAAVAECGFNGQWSSQVNGKTEQHTYRAKSGEIVSWWPGTGTILFQGARPDEFKAKLEPYLLGAPAPAAAAPKDAKIFIVHGHDREARDQLELVLMRLGLRPFILQNADGASNTIIEALEQHIYKEAAFGIVLLTPDDYGYPKNKTEADRQPRARQNVVLELGMVMAALGRQRMVILKKGALEMPSDAGGILYIEFNEHIREIVPKLAQRLQGAGFQIDPKSIADASA